MSRDIALEAAADYFDNGGFRDLHASTLLVQLVIFRILLPSWY